MVHVLSTMAWISFGGTGWFAWRWWRAKCRRCCSRPASSWPRAQPKSLAAERTRQESSRCRTPTDNVGNPNSNVIVLKPLIKILPVTLVRRNPNGAVPRIAKQPWSTELKQAARGFQLRPKSDFRQVVAVIAEGSTGGIRSQGTHRRGFLPGGPGERLVSRLGRGVSHGKTALRLTFPDRICRCDLTPQGER